MYIFAKKYSKMFLLKQIIVCVFFFSSVVFAQQKKQIDSVKVNQLKTVIVTATRTERKIASLPLPTAVITAATIQKAGVTRLNEILSEQTGLIMVPDFGGVEGIQIQGLDSAYTLILIDGVPLVGRSAGTLDLSRVSVGNIDRIEIVKGASSSLYGSEALAGVVNIITKKPLKDSFSGNVAFRLATFNTIDNNANFVWKKKKLGGSFFSNYFASDGYDLDTKNELKTVEKYANTTFQPKLYYDFSDNFKLVASARFYNQKQDNKAQINNLIYEGKASINETNYQIKVDQKWNGQFNSEYEVYATNFKTTELLNNPSQQLFDESFFNQWLFRPEIRTTLSLKNSKITSGIGLNYETLDRTYFSNKAVFNSQYVFAQFDYNPTKKWNVLAGLRYDNHNQYESQFSPKLAINFKVNDDLSLKTSVGYGFKAPDFRQLYFDFTNPAVGYTVLGYNVAETRLNQFQSQGQLLFRNPNFNFSNPLKPESSINFNFGTYFQRKNLKIEINTFYNSIKNLIDTRVVAQKTNGQNVFSYFNIDEIFTYGIELNTTYNITPEFKISAGYQYLIANDKAVVDAIADGKVFARDPQTLDSFKIKQSDYFGLFDRSKHTANIKFLYEIPRWKTDINLRVFYRSKYGLFDSNSNQILDVYDAFVKEYLLTNLSISKAIQEKFTLQIGANNLFNFTNPTEISNIAGRQIFGRIQFNF